MVKHFDRLRGTNLSLRGSPIDRAIDECSGRLEHDMAAFTAFVWDCVWTWLPPEAFDSSLTAL